MQKVHKLDRQMVDAKWQYLTWTLMLNLFFCLHELQYHFRHLHWADFMNSLLLLKFSVKLFVAFKIHNDNGTNCSFWARYTLFPLGFWIVQANWTNICCIIWKEWLTKYMCINIIESFGFMLDQELTSITVSTAH